MSAQATKQPAKYVKSLRGSAKLVKGKVYEVVKREFEEVYLQDGTRPVGWFLDSYFEPMPPTYDHKEETLRAILTTPSHDCTCKKCGAPIPCAYHS